MYACGVCVRVRAPERLIVCGVAWLWWWCVRVCARVRGDECVIVIESARVKCACVVKSCVRMGVPACVEDYSKGLFKKTI